ncbi:MAG: apolipoprotein N-acyltransferase [Candidatus Binatia bacterium]
MRVAGILLGGVLYGLALPPFDWALCGWVALVPLLLALPGESVAPAFRYGCLFGYASGWAVLWPLVEAASRYFEVPTAVAVPGVALWFLVVVGLPFGVFAAGAAALLRARTSAATSLAVAALWVACELLRGRAIGQPWGLLGYTQHAQIALVQLASWTGVYGVSFLLVAVSTALAIAARRAVTAAKGRDIVSILALPSLLVASCWVGGTTALRTAVPPTADAERPVAIVQTNLTPPLRWTQSYTGAQVGAHLRATETIPLTVRPALIVWPEYAVPRFVETDPGLATMLGATARRHHADLLFGTPRHQDGHTYNSVDLIRSDGRPAGYYDKRRLVLFAEENPFRYRAPVRADAAAFAHGTAPGVLPGFARLGVSICHEILHPDLIGESVRHGAELLVNVANDSWLDGSSDAAGLQHLAMATFRAVETHRYLVRAATTGTSAVFDPFGRVLASLPAGHRGVLTANVAPSDAETWYVRLGDTFAYGCTLVALLALLACWSSSRPPVAGRPAA